MGPKTSNTDIMSGVEVQKVLDQMKNLGELAKDFEGAMTSGDEVMARAILLKIEGAPELLRWSFEQAGISLLPRV